VILAYIPCGSEEEAEKIAVELVGKKLIACANIIQSRSIYEWDNKLEKTNEWLILAKTTKGRFVQVRERVKELHSYELPCIIGLPVEYGNKDYIDWVEKLLR
jgi:periplasmic divalent cation tolerance protein